MGWIGPLLKLLGGLLGLFREQQVRKEAKGLQAAQDAAVTAKETIREVQAANDAREAERRILAREPERLRDDDGFKRPD